MLHFLVLIIILTVPTTEAKDCPPDLSTPTERDTDPNTAAQADRVPLSLAVLITPIL